MSQFMRPSAPVRLAIRIFDLLLKKQTRWRNQGIDYDLIDLGKKASERVREHVGAERIISFSVDETPIVRVYLRLVAHWGWEAYRYDFRELEWYTDVTRLDRDKPYYKSDWRCYPVVDYYQFTDRWASEDLCPTLTQRPVIL